ncbi:metallophosphoesterase [Halarchaeum sp. CBA1220]|uniref:metallophosphoesterase family protein n=1 Tax=Halarchaeum sp. CBA1220 TaxID=1853682 RepID=UPI0021032A64|nr:metallophosphoesterase [Halarchaeum sp. CBA1220]
MTPRPGPVLARLARPAGPETTLAVLADVHADAARESGSWKCHEHALDRLRTALDDAGRLGADAVLVAGDLTRDGRPDSFDAVDAAFATFDGPVLCVPGNHDVPKTYRDAPSVHAFRERYTPGVLPYVRRVGSVHVVGLDTASAVEDGSHGRVTDDQLAWLDAVLPTIGEAVVVCHHNLADVLADHDVPLAVSGHAHWPTVGTAGRVRELLAPAVCSFPQAGLLLDVTPEGTTVSMLPLADRDGLRAAHDAARDGTERSRRIVETFRDGYLTRFPLVDERTRNNPNATRLPLER